MNLFSYVFDPDVIKAFLKKVWKEIKSWVNVLLVIVGINCLLYQPFKIPSGSMIPTLLVGDFLIVNKFCYGYSNNSFRIDRFTIPLPKINGRLFGKNLPQRGDVVVFRNPKDKDLNYIKRIIGLPGETVEFINGVVHINGTPLAQRYVDSYSILDRDHYDMYNKYMELLPEGKEHVMIKAEEFGKGWLDNAGPFVVPEGHYFMAGDNRDRSSDSRVQEAVGFVPLENIMGRAELIFFSTTAKWYEILKWPFSVRFERILNKIK